MPAYAAVREQRGRKEADGLAAAAFRWYAAALAGVRMVRPTVPVIANVTAREVSDPAEIRRSLEAQVTGSVRWTESMQCLRD